MEKGDRRGRRERGGGEMGWWKESGEINSCVVRKKDVRKGDDRG